MVEYINYNGKNKLKTFLEKILIRFLLSDVVKKHLRTEILHVYEKESLSIKRIWGDETRLETGKNVVLNDAVINLVSGKVTIDNDTFLGHGVSLLTGTHDYTKTGVERQVAVPECGRNIVIGKSVWIASNAQILGPCEIGDYAVIGAGSIVTGKVKGKSLYAGSPAKLIRRIDLDE